MRNFLDVLRFELRQQCSSPMFAALLVLFFLIHLLTISQVGINLDENSLVADNSVYKIFLVELLLGIFGMLPAVMFVVNAAVRDHAQTTAELIYATPVGKLAFLLGRFSGGTLCALLVGLAGVLGTLTGTFMPWLEAERLMAFSWQPYAVVFATLVVPNLLVFCAFSFCVATLSRTAVLSFGVALVFVVLSLVINTHARGDAPEWLSMLDPFGGLAVQQAMRYWSVVELNTLMPVGDLPANRLLWLTLAALFLVVTCLRFRLEFAAASGTPFRLRRSKPQPAPVPSTREWRSSFGARDTLAQLSSQLRMDLRAVLLSPLFWIVMLLAAIAIENEVRAKVAPIMQLPLHPMTSQMLGFFRAALFQFALIVIIFYSALLMHREREHRLHEILGASPYPDWVPLTSKVLTLCFVVLLMMLVSMLVCIGLQATAGYYDFELGVYLQALFVNTGFYFCMLAVLACVLQTLVPGKWSGMLVVLGVLVALLSLPALGWEHLLYGFRIPNITYSDLNGFGHFLLSTYSLIVYWGAFCVLLMLAGHLLLPRGTWASLRARLRDAATRLTPATKATAAAAAAVFALAGAWIFYNTNILNEYQTAASRMDRQAEYERRFAAYKKQPVALPVDIAMEVDLYPGERRLVSRGSMTLRNGNAVALDKVIVSADPRLHLESLEVRGGSRSLQDTSLGFFVFNLDRPLEPGSETQLTWAAVRHHRGFDNAGTDTDIVENGTFVDSLAVMPFPIYVDGRELTDNRERRRRGLPPRPEGLPALGDSAYLNTLGESVDLRPLNYRVVFSTDADQTAVAPGELYREWTRGGRRYFDYRMERPIRPRISLSSARYQVARDSWNGVAIEIYHDARHAWNVKTMVDTAKSALEYYSGEFAPYMFKYFRIVEYPGYENHAQAFPGTIPYTETVGFLTDLRSWGQVDLATAHELAHMWWGGLAYGAFMQGRKILNEGMAEYSSLMLLKQQQNPLWLRKVLADRHNAYLNGRRGAKLAELPVIRAEDQHPHITYGKSAHVMFAVQELIGADKVHQALRAYLDRFADRPPPYPMSLDLVKEVRAVAGPEYQSLITDLFEKIMLYDVRMAGVHVTPVDEGYDVTMDIAARQFESDGIGNETEVQLDTWFQLVIFPDSKQELLAQAPLYQQHHRLRSGTQRVTVRVPKKPGAAGVDPFHLMFDKTPKDNIRLVDWTSFAKTGNTNGEGRRLASEAEGR